MNFTPEILRKSIATRLSAAREKAGLSQKLVAKRLNISRPSVSEIEHGKRKVTAEEFIHLASLYNVSLDWLAARRKSSIPCTDEEACA